MSTAYLSLVESGKRSPSREMAMHIARRLGVELEEILSGRPSGLEPRLELAVGDARRLLHSGERDEAVASLEGVLAEALRYDLDRLAAKSLTLLGGVAVSTDVEAARELYDRAMEKLAGQPPHTRFEAVVGLAKCSHLSGDTRMAVFMLEKYLVELRAARVEDPTARMRVLSALVQYYRILGLDRRAIEAAHESSSLAPIVDDPEQLACMSMNVARVLYEEGRHDDAIEALLRAETVYQSLDWPLPATRAKMNLGIVQASKGNLSGAHGSFASVLADLERFPDEHSARAEVLNEIARVERQMGDFMAAIDHLTEARRYLPKADAVERGLNAREMALCLAETDGAAAEKEFKKSARIYLEAGAESEAAKALLEYGRFLRSNAREAEAVGVFEEGLALAAKS